MVEWLAALAVAGLVIGCICAVTALLPQSKAAASEAAQATVDVINQAHEQRQPVKVVRIEHPETMQQQAKGFDVNDLFR